MSCVAETTPEENRRLVDITSAPCEIFIRGKGDANGVECTHAVIGEHALSYADYSIFSSGHGRDVDHFVVGYVEASRDVHEPGCGCAVVMSPRSRFAPDRNSSHPPRSRSHGAFPRCCHHSNRHPEVIYLIRCVAIVTAGKLPSV